MPHFVHFSPSLLNLKSGIQLKTLNLFSAPMDMPVGQKRHQNRRTLNDAARMPKTSRYAKGKASGVLWR
jgi:hypothetical protein